MWNTDWKSRIGWGTDNEKRGRDADNFKLNGLGRKYDMRPDNLSDDIKGMFKDDEKNKSLEDLTPEEKERCDNGTFD